MEPAVRQPTSTRARLATHAAAALLGAGVALIGVRACGASGSGDASNRVAPPAASASRPSSVESAHQTARDRPEASAGRSIPVIVRFNVSNPAVSVTQRDNGTLEVVNSDPKLSGTQLPIEGVTANGKVLTFNVRVPAPRATP